MITKWKIIDPLGDNTTTFRFWCNDESSDLNTGSDLVDKYTALWGYKSEGLIKIVYDEGNIYYEIITSLPFSIYLENNDFYEFEAVNPKRIKGIKNNK